MVRTRRFIPIGILLFCACLLQWKTGNIDFSYFAFPISIVLPCALIGIAYVAYQEKRDCTTMQMLMSTTTSVLLLVLGLVGSLVIAFGPELNFQRSWPFSLILLLLLANLQFAIMRYRGKHRKRFLLTHIGLYLFIAALTFGAPDTHRSRAIIREGQTIEQAYDFEGKIRPIGFPLTLQHFEVSYYDNRVPRSFKATVKADGNVHEIRVNHPWQRSWQEDIYLVSHGIDKASRQPYCVLELITQPWKYIVQFGLILTAAGAFMLLWGKRNKQ